MHGGYREGSGRKSLNNLKKKNRNIYITDDFYNEIMSIDMKEHKSFSERCRYLLKEGLLNYKKESDDIVSNKLKLIDLFAGIGGIRKGFEDSNTAFVFSSEWDKFAQKTYEENYGEKPEGDITQINAEDIPEHDIVLAGFPCQPFSSIGKRQGFEHVTQGTLFYDVLRIIRYHEPKAFLLENVPGLLTIQNGETFDVIIEALKESGYTVFYKVLDAQNFGLPQIRKRVIIIGFRDDLGINNFEISESNGNKKAVIGDLLEETDPAGYSISEHLQEKYLFKKDDGRPQIVNKDSKIQVKTLVSTYHKIQRLTGTFVEGGETGLRLLSELECKRIMGFPDNFLIPVSRTQMYRQFGNSVAVPMIKSVADEMKKEIYKSNQISLKQLTFTI